MLGTRILATWQIQPDPYAQWGRFSPESPDSVLLSAGGEGLLLSVRDGAVRRLAKDLLPVGWIGNTLVVRDKTGAFQFLHPDTLQPAAKVAAGTVALPWTLGKDRRLLVAVTPGAKGAVVIDEESAAFKAGADAPDRTIVDSRGRVVLEASRKIYGIMPSPDTYKMVVYYGNRDYILFNRLTRMATPLPPSIHAWWWMPDSSTLLGEVSVGGKPGQEQVTGTTLHMYQDRGELKRVVVPPEIQGAALKILDISSQGNVLLEAERTDDKPPRPRLAVLEIRWQ